MCDIFKHFLKFRMQKKSFISPNKDIRVWMHAQYLLHHGHTCSLCVYCGELPCLLFSWIFKYWNKQPSGDCTSHHSATPGTQPPALIWLKNISFSFPLIFADGAIKCAITPFQRKCFSCNRNNLKLNYKRSIKQLWGWQWTALLGTHWRVTQKYAITKFVEM